MQCETKKKIRQRLNRVAGQVAGLQKMVEEDRYCVDILTQLAAVRSALDAIGVGLLTDHVEHCMLGHGTGLEHPQAKKMSKEDLLGEVRVAINRFLS